MLWIRHISRMNNKKKSSDWQQVAAVNSVTDPLACFISLHLMNWQVGCFILWSEIHTCWCVFLQINCNRGLLAAYFSCLSLFSTWWLLDWFGAFNDHLFDNLRQQWHFFFFSEKPISWAKQPREICRVNQRFLIFSLLFSLICSWQDYFHKSGAT